MNMPAIPSRRSGSLVAIAALAAAVALPGCASQLDTPMPSVSRHKIQVAESVERLELYPRADGMALSVRDRQAMTAFLAAYGQVGNGPLYINRPEGGASGIDAAQSQLRGTLGQLGLAGARVQTGSYRTAPGAPAPLVVSYRRLKTLVPDCRVSSDLALTHHNAPSADWGCAHHANIAAMVADPNQFLAPYAPGEPDSQRRAAIYGKYIEGEVTASAKPPEQKVSSQTPRE